MGEAWASSSIHSMSLGLVLLFGETFSGITFTVPELGFGIALVGWFVGQFIHLDAGSLVTYHDLVHASLPNWFLVR